MVDQRIINTALQERRSVRIERRLLEPGYINGFIVAASSHLVLVQNICEQIMLDGFYVIRRADVTAIENPDPYASFHESALRLRDEMPNFEVSIDLSSIRSALRSIANHSEIVTVHIEEDDAAICYIGKVTNWGDNEFQLKLLAPSATWRGSATFDYSQITRVDYAGLYEDALLQVATHGHPGTEGRDREH